MLSFSRSVFDDKDFATDESSEIDKSVAFEFPNKHGAEINDDEVYDINTDF